MRFFGHQKPSWSVTQKVPSSSTQMPLAARSPLAGALGLGALAAFTSVYHPLGVASYTTVNDRVVSIGAFGMVFVRQPSAERER